jgi:hypothetical protein
LKQQNTAIEFKVIKENPFTKVKSVAHYPNKKYLLSEQEIQDLLAFCNKSQFVVKHANAYDNYSSSPHLSDSRYHPSSLKLFHDLKMKQDEHPYL